MVTFARPGSESLDTRPRQLLGINLPCGRQHDGFMGNDERMRAQPWVDAATPPTPSTALPAERGGVGQYRRTTSFRTRRSQLSAAQQRTWERLWPELGTAAREATSGNDSEGPLEPLDTGAQTPISTVRPATKYEGKARDAGSAVTEFLWERRSR